MHRLLALAAVLTLLLTACSDDGGDDESFDDAGTTEVASGDDLPESVVVFSPEDSETDSYGEPTTWTPGVEDVLAAEELLAEHIEALPELGIGAIDTYVRQYVGVGDGEDLVSVNALCEEVLDSLGDWEDSFIVVDDGGPCFWQATVDLPTAEVQSFTVNGEA